MPRKDANAKGGEAPRFICDHPGCGKVSGHFTFIGACLAFQEQGGVE